MPNSRKTAPVERGINFPEEVRNFEIQLIKQALAQCNGCQKRAARYLNVKYTTLFEKIKRYAIKVRSDI